jgi:hypothetical protein
MDINKYDFPEVTALDIALPTFGTDKELLAEAKERGFYNGNTKYNRLFGKLFFEGGTLNFKADIDDEFKVKATAYLKAFMGSFTPSHQEKEAVCALLLSELVEA